MRVVYCCDLLSFIPCSIFVDYILLMLGRPGTLEFIFCRILEVCQFTQVDGQCDKLQNVE